MSNRIKNYVLVAKPGIMFGNLISAAAGFFLASKGRIDGALLPATLIGISLVVAAGGVFNNCVDKNLDRKMVRTRHRALAQGLISPRSALSCATILGMAGLALLFAATNLLTVSIVLAGLVIYVGVYSLYLKRNSVYSALIGSLAGATPPVAGYCAVTGRFDLGAMILLAIFSLWQMPHCYAIAVFRFDDYAAAAIPVLPVQKGTAAAKRHIVWYILAFMAVTMMLTLAGYTGYRTLAVATVLGLSWLFMAWSGYKAADERLWARKLFIFSIVTIFILSFMMATDFTAPVPAHNTAELCSVVRTLPGSAGRPRPLELTCVFPHPGGGSRRPSRTAKTKGFQEYGALLLSPTRHIPLTCTFFPMDKILWAIGTR
jgi:protoheme IX farnesyltransferase